MITNQKELRRAFWEAHPECSRKRRKGIYCADTRVAFVDYVDACARDGIISEALALRATLGRLVMLPIMPGIYPGMIGNTCRRDGPAKLRGQP